MRDIIIGKQTAGSNDHSCVKCFSNETTYEPEKSGWAFFSECKNCGHKHFWSCNDMMSGAIHQYELVSQGEEWMPEYYRDRKPESEIIRMPENFGPTFEEMEQDQKDHPENWGTIKQDGYTFDFKNFGMLIPKGPVVRDDGKPAMFIRYKEAFMDHLISENRLEEIQAMSWAERDEEYMKWEKTYTPTERDKREWSVIDNTGT